MPSGRSSRAPSWRPGSKPGVRDAQAIKDSPSASDQSSRQRHSRRKDQDMTYPRYARNALAPTRPTSARSPFRAHRRPFISASDADLSHRAHAGLVHSADSRRSRLPPRRATNRQTQALSWSTHVPARHRHRSRLGRCGSTRRRALRTHRRRRQGQIGCRVLHREFRGLGRRVVRDLAARSHAVLRTTSTPGSRSPPAGSHIRSAQGITANIAVDDLDLNGGANKRGHHRRDQRNHRLDFRGDAGICQHRPQGGHRRVPRRQLLQFPVGLDLD